MKLLLYRVARSGRIISKASIDSVRVPLDCVYVEFLAVYYISSMHESDAIQIFEK